MSNSISGILWNYCRTRFPLWLALVWPLFIVLPGLALGNIRSATELLVAWCLALLLFAEFRLGDDLCDREQDCREQPSRVLCQPGALPPLNLLLAVLAVSNSVLIYWYGSWLAVAILFALHIGLASWYAARKSLQLGPVANYHVVLLKYPAFALLFTLSAPQTATLPAALAILYLALCVVEVLHDRRLRALRTARICAGLAALLLGGITIGLLMGWM